MSKPAARKPTIAVSGYETSLVRCAVVAILVLAGIAWITVYTQFAMDAANYVQGFGIKKPHTPLPWMSDLKQWNYLIGFGLIWPGPDRLRPQADPARPRPRRRGRHARQLPDRPVWIVVYYFVGQDANVHLPVMDQLDQYNLLVGVGFMAVGFTFATKWE